MSEVNPIQIRAKYQGTCDACGDATYTGDPILWNPQTKRVTHYPNCSQPLGSGELTERVLAESPYLYDEAHAHDPYDLDRPGSPMSPTLEERQLDTPHDFDLPPSFPDWTDRTVDLDRIRRKAKEPQ